MVLRSDLKKPTSQSSQKRALREANKLDKLCLRFRTIVTDDLSKLHGVRIRGLNGKWDLADAPWMIEEENKIPGCSYRVFDYSLTIDKCKYKDFTCHEYKYYLIFADGTNQWEELKPVFDWESKTAWNRVIKAPHDLEINYHIQHDVITRNKDRQQHSRLWLQSLPLLLDSLKAEGESNNMVVTLIKAKQILQSYKVLILIMYLYEV